MPAPRTNLLVNTFTATTMQRLALLFRNCMFFSLEASGRVWVDIFFLNTTMQITRPVNPKKGEKNTHLQYYLEIRERRMQVHRFLLFIYAVTARLLYSFTYKTSQRVQRLLSSVRMGQLTTLSLSDCCGFRITKHVPPISYPSLICTV